MRYEYSAAFFQKSTDYILNRVGQKPEVAIILGSALGDMSADILDAVVIPYAEIPNFLVSTVEGHAGELIYGTLRGKRVICMSGRFHNYEGYDFEQLVIPIRVFKLLGVSTVVVTNAAGGINYNYDPGDICVINDHINFVASPLRGANVKEIGPIFPSLNNAYPKPLRQLAKQCARKLDFELREGVYFYARGPHYETPAEIRAMRILGADVVGMSTVPEVITAAHCQLPALCLSMVTNKSSDQVVDHDVTEGVFVLDDKVMGRFRALVAEIVQAL